MIDREVRMFTVFGFASPDLSKINSQLAIRHSILDSLHFTFAEPAISTALLTEALHVLLGTVTLANPLLRLSTKTGESWVGNLLVSTWKFTWNCNQTIDEVMIGTILPPTRRQKKQMRDPRRAYRLQYLWLVVVGAEGFEPPTLCSQSRCATRLRYAPISFIDCNPIRYCSISLDAFRGAFRPVLNRGIQIISRQICSAPRIHIAFPSMLQSIG